MDNSKNNKKENSNKNENTKKFLDNHLLELEGEYNTLFNRMNKRRQELNEEQLNNKKSKNES
jgi:hypothetical protein